MVLVKHLHELNARRHMLGVVRADAVQLGHQLWSDALGLAQYQPAMDYSMPDAGHLGEPDMTIQPANQKRRRRPVIGCTNDTRGGLAAAVMDRQRWLGQADAFDLAGKQPRGGRVGAVEGELDARRPAVNRQDALGWLAGRLGTGRCVGAGPARHVTPC